MAHDFNFDDDDSGGFDLEAKLAASDREELLRDKGLIGLALGSLALALVGPFTALLADKQINPLLLPFKLVALIWHVGLQVVGWILIVLALLGGIGYVAVSYLLQTYG